MDAFIGEIRVFPFSYAPEGWLPCDGRKLSVAQFAALYSLIGVTYGGDGRVDFALPRLNGRVVAGVGQGPGLRVWQFAETFGTQTVTLESKHVPPHNHSFNARLPSAVATATRGSPEPVNGTTCTLTRPGRRPPTGNPLIFPIFDKPPEVATTLASNAIGTAGGTSTGVLEAHNNMMPTLAMNYCICIDGEYPAFDD